jgi:ATP-dependent helicase Lhr and Lhr-like helicase
MSFDLLSQPIRKYIRDKRWEELRPIQAAAIARILSTEDNYILASRTASGKTEAAFLPILSKINLGQRGVQVLYVSPLIALINDQFLRIEELCNYLDLPVTKWHGEASVGAKNRLLKQPEGIVLITPESLEAMFVNKPYNVKQLFSNLQFVVIDEIHSFIGSDRGIQLKSLLSRLQSLNSNKVRMVGLSATIGDYDEAKKFTGDESGTKVLLDKTSKEIQVEFRYFETDKDELPLDLLKNLYLETKDNKVLLFPNSRGRAEEVAVKLKKISDKVGGHKNYFSHHSSVDKEVREYVEFFAKNNKRQNFLISCTSTLELGIDIGSVDEVVQVDATHSIASLIQRVGRSGRREGEKSYLFLYATNKWSLLQSLACWTLYKEGYIEPPAINKKPYDILLHQVLSIVKSTSGISYNELLNQAHKNFAFDRITIEEIRQILDHLIKIDFLEKIQEELIIGVEGEQVVNSRDFYSVFKTEENFNVVHQGHTIGGIPFSLQIMEGENILLAAKMWKIKFVDERAKKIEVDVANDGKKPIFFGSGVFIHSQIRQRMIELLYNDNQFDFLDESARNAINEMRNDFSSFKIQNIETDRPLLVGEKYVELYSFTSTRINRTLSFLLNSIGVKTRVDEKSSMLDIEASKKDLISSFSNLAGIDIEFELGKLVATNPAVLDFSKWSMHLPIKYKVQLLKNRYFDFDGINHFLTSLNLVSNT